MPVAVRGGRVVAGEVRGAERALRFQPTLQGEVGLTGCTEKRGVAQGLLETSVSSSANLWHSVFPTPGPSMEALDTVVQAALAGAWGEMFPSVEATGREGHWRAWLGYSASVSRRTRFPRPSGILGRSRKECSYVKDPSGNFQGSHHPTEDLLADGGVQARIGRDPQCKEAAPTPPHCIPSPCKVCWEPQTGLVQAQGQQIKVGS